MYMRAVGFCFGGFELVQVAVWSASVVVSL